MHASVKAPLKCLSDGTGYCAVATTTERGGVTEFVRTGPCLIVVGSPGVDRDIPGLRKALTHTSFFQPGPTMHKNRYHDVLFRRETVKGISAVIQIKMLWSRRERQHTSAHGAERPPLAFAQKT